MNEVTPATLSRELHVDQRRIRDFLRQVYGTLVPPTTRWVLTPEQAEMVRAYFGLTAGRPTGG